MIAFIFVAENGENCIAVAPGANNLLRGERMDTILPVIKEADALVLQLEIPYESVISLIEYAHTVDTKIILNPAPAKHIRQSTLRQFFRSLSLLRWRNVWDSGIIAPHKNLRVFLYGDVRSAS